MWTAVRIFDTPENVQASTVAAADYVVANDLGGYFVDSNPVVVEGSVIINAGFLVNLESQERGVFDSFLNCLAR